MTTIESTGGGTALLEEPEMDEFELDVRAVLSHQAATCSNSCPTDDGCGSSCSNGASACSSESNNQF